MATGDYSVWKVILPKPQAKISGSKIFQVYNVLPLSLFLLGIPKGIPNFKMGLKTGSAEKCTIELGRGDFIG